MVCGQGQQKPSGISTAKLATERFDGVWALLFCIGDGLFPWLRVGRVPPRHVGRAELASWRASAQRLRLCGRCHQGWTRGRSRHVRDMNSLVSLEVGFDVSGTPHPVRESFGALTRFLRRLSYSSGFSCATTEVEDMLEMRVLLTFGSHSLELQSWVPKYNSL
jgi:hypothetical protein